MDGPLRDVSVPAESASRRRVTLRIGVGVAAVFAAVLASVLTEGAASDMSRSPVKIVGVMAVLPSWFAFFALSHEALALPRPRLTAPQVVIGLGVFGLVSRASWAALDFMLARWTASGIEF